MDGSRTSTYSIGYSIEIATAADITGVLDVLTSVATEERWIGTELPIDHGARGRVLLSTIERTDAVTLVARAGDVVVGALTLRPQWPGLLQLGMCIVAGWRSQGVGSALLSRSIGWARDSNAHKIILDVFPHNTPAIALYKKFGFEQEGYFRRHIPRRSGELWDVIAMGLPLS